MAGGATKETRDKWLRKNPDYMRQYHNARRLELRDWLREIKEAQACTDCGASFPSPAMDYHHVRGERKASVQSLVNRTSSKETIMKEIDKCVLLCANCHRIRHHCQAAA